MSDFLKEENRKDSEINQEQKRNENFAMVSNRIAYYYKEVFNIEIISLFYKKKTEEKLRKIQNKGIDKLRGLVFDFYVLIKDNNLKIFKYKIIKCSSNASYFIANRENFSFIDNLYNYVDDELVNYCNKKYMNDKTPREKIMQFQQKSEEVNEDYKNWKIENYK